MTSILKLLGLSRDIWKGLPPLFQGLFIILPIHVVLWSLLLLFSVHPLPEDLIAGYRVKSMKFALTSALNLEQAKASVSMMTAGKLPRVSTQDQRFSCVPGAKFPTLWFTFERDLNLSGPPQALLVSYVHDNSIAYVNGKLIDYPRGVFAETPSRHGRKPQLMGLPSHLLVDGVNRFDILVRGNGCHADVTGVLVGPYQDLEKFYKWAESTRIVLPEVTMTIALVTALLCIILVFFAGDRRLYITISFIMLFQAFIQFDYLWLGQYPGYMGKVLIYNFISMMSSSSIMLFTFFWTSSRSAGDVKVICIVAGLHCIGMLAVSWLGWPLFIGWFDLSLALTAFAYMAWRTVRFYFENPRDAVWAAGVLSLLLVATIVTDVVTILRIPTRYNLTSMVPLVVTLVLGVYLALRAAGLYIDTSRTLRALVVELAEKEGKIREHERMRTLFEERERLISDMHDGVGGQLTGLMAQLRLRKMEQGEISSSVQAVIDDLRLVIDSLDSVGDSLAEALETFRHRMESRLKALGIELIWTDRLQVSPVGFRSQEILNIYRILQESFSNTIRHAKAGRISVTIAQDPQSNAHIVLTIEDNGQGFVGTSSGGRGLGSLRKRARLLGGTIEILEADPRGVLVRLWVPVPQSA